MPSLRDNSPMVICECLEQGIPFVASNIGGIPELIHPDDRSRVLAEPIPFRLGDLLTTTIQDGAVLPRSGVDYKRNLREWDDFHRSIADEPIAKTAGNDHSQPLVSACVVYRQNEHHLRQAVASLREQTYPNMEIVIAGGERRWLVKDTLERVRQEFDDLPVTIAIEQNMHAAAAGNLAVRAARGDFLLFLDESNVARPELTERLVSVALATDADIVTTAMDTFSGDGPPAESPPEARHLYLGSSPELGLFFNCFGHGAALVRRKVFEELGLFTEICDVDRQDHEFFAKAVLAGYRLETLSEALLMHRRDYRKKGHHRRFANHAEMQRVMAAYRPHLPVYAMEALRLGLGCHEENS